MIDRNELDELLRHQARPAVTITMPCNVPGLEIRQDAIRLDNLLNEAERRLIAHGTEKRAVAAMLEPARRLVGETPFWAQGRRGLAVFLASGFIRTFDLDDAIEEVIGCGDHFRITSLLTHVIEPSPEFFVLAVSKERAVLYRAGPEGMRSEPVPLCEATPETSILDPDRIEARADEAIGGSSAPIILAGQPEATGSFRKKSRLKFLVPEHIDINPWAVSADELHHSAWAVAGPRFDSAAADAIDHLNSLQGSSRASTDTAELVKAARWGRMDTLLLGQGSHVWGHFNEQVDRVEAHAEPALDDEDLLDLAAQLTLLNGGVVKVVAPGQLPGGAPAAGIMRY